MLALEPLGTHCTCGTLCVSACAFVCVCVCVCVCIIACPCPCLEDSDVSETMEFPIVVMGGLIGARGAKINEADSSARFQIGRACGGRDAPCNDG